MAIGGNKMENKFALIGGDLRSVKLAKLLAKEKNIVYTYGLEKVEELKKEPNIILSKTLKEAIKETKNVIGPIPFSNKENYINSPFSKEDITIQELIQNTRQKVLIAGSIHLEIQKLAKQNEVELIDIMEKEELAILNAISTAEGAIEIGMKHTNHILHGSKILILGFGRIGKVLAKKLQGLSANVTCVARKLEDMAWMKAYGYQDADIHTLGENLSQYDIIINTVPQLLLTAEKLQYVKKETLLMDLASKPGGIDQKTVEEMGLKFIWGLALPGKVAPLTTAEFIKSTIYHTLEGEKICS